MYRRCKLRPSAKVDLEHLLRQKKDDLPLFLTTRQRSILVTYTFLSGRERRQSGLLPLRSRQFRTQIQSPQNRRVVPVYIGLEHHATIITQVHRPVSQQHWHLDGKPDVFSLAVGQLRLDPGTVPMHRIVEQQLHQLQRVLDPDAA